MADAEDAEKNLRGMAAEWESFGVKLADIRIVQLKREDWAESWKIHFKTMEISDRLVIRPSWEKFEPKSGQVVIELDPGMSFGTGQHATTKFCLSALDRFARERASDIAAEKSRCSTRVQAPGYLRLPHASWDTSESMRSTSTPTR
jgi:ribosomal protein L11 methylase PrmA